MASSIVRELTGDGIASFQLNCQNIESEFMTDIEQFLKFASNIVRPKLINIISRHNKIEVDAEFLATFISVNEKSRESRHYFNQRTDKIPLDMMCDVDDFYNNNIVCDIRRVLVNFFSVVPNNATLHSIDGFKVCIYDDPDAQIRVDRVHMASSSSFRLVCSKGFADQKGFFKVASNVVRSRLMDIINERKRVKVGMYFSGIFSQDEYQDAQAERLFTYRTCKATLLRSFAEVDNFFKHQIVRDVSWGLSDFLMYNPNLLLSQIEELEITVENSNDYMMDDEADDDAE